MKDARPWLQIVHVGGMHLVEGSGQAWALHRALHRRGLTIERPLTHDPSAIRAARVLVERLTGGDPVWRRVPTVLTMTAPATRYGDARSHALASATVRDLTHAMAAGHALAFAGRSEESLPWSPVYWPAPPWSLPSPTRRTEVQLYGAEPSDPTSASRLEALFAHHAPPAGSHALRIVCQHDVDARAPRGVDLVLGTGLTASEGAPLRWPVARAFDRLHEQELQVLRLHWSVAHPAEVAIDRAVATRALGVGPFRFDPGDARSRRVVISLSAP